MGPEGPLAERGASRLTFLGPKEGDKAQEPLPGEIPSQAAPAEADSDYKHLDLVLPKPTYVAIAKLVHLLRGESDDELVSEFVRRAVEAYIPIVGGQVEAIKSARSLPSVYIDASPRS